MLLLILLFCFTSKIVIAQNLFQSTTKATNLGQVEDEVSWILGLQRESGAFTLSFRPNDTTTDTRINPYFTNIALTNVLRVNTNNSTLTSIKKYLNWYIAHLNFPDRWGNNGSIYDYIVTKDNLEISQNNADSTDAYAATFLTLIKSYLDATGDRHYVKDLETKLQIIADSIWVTYDPNLQLTNAKPDYSAAYLMDNVEVWKGLKDYSEMLANLNHPDAHNYYERAELIRVGIEVNLWFPENNEYQYAYFNPKRPTNWNIFYPDVTANLFPIKMKFPTAIEKSRRLNLYKKFASSSTFEFWKNPDPSGFPWISLTEVVRMCDQTEAGNVMLQEFKQKIIDNVYPDRKYPWIITESADFAVLLMDT